MESQSKAFSRQARGILKRELKALRSLVGEQPERGARFGGQGGLAEVFAQSPAVKEVMEGTDAELADKLNRYMQQASSESWKVAGDYVDAAKGDVVSSLQHTIAARSEAVANSFGTFRADKLQEVLSGALFTDQAPREVAVAVGQAWSGLSDYYVDGIARTETAWAYEKAAITQWRGAGLDTFDFVFGGGPCTTGVCEEAQADSPYSFASGTGDVGFSFQGADSPPLHPACTCFMAPSVPPELVDAGAPDTNLPEASTEEAPPG